MDGYEWQREYKGSGPLSLDEFLRRHGEHGIIVCENNNMMPMPTPPESIRHMCGGNAKGQYLGNESPFFMDNEDLLFVIRLMTKKGTSRKKRHIHLVVSVH